MAMKLLSPSEARAKAQRSEDAEKHRLVGIQALIAQKLKELADAEKAFDDATQRQRNQWATERQEHETHILSLRKTVEELEERKKQALLPLTEKAKELDTKASALDAREVELNLRAAGIDQDKELLERRLDEVAEREVQADKVAKSLEAQKKGIEGQASQVKISSAALTVAMEAASKEATERDRALQLREAAAKTREFHLEERERKVQELNDGLTKRELALADERKALTAAADELRKKYGYK